MEHSPTVLLLVHNAAERNAVSRKLTDMAAVPIIVHADCAVDAVEAYRPVAAVLDQAHASTAPDSFLAMTSAHHVRLLTLSYPQFGSAIDDDLLRRMVGAPVAVVPRAD
jgi:hypothetical protein